MTGEQFHSLWQEEHAPLDGNALNTDQTWAENPSDIVPAFEKFEARETKCLSFLRTDKNKK